MPLHLGIEAHHGEVRVVAADGQIAALKEQRKRVAAEIVDGAQQIGRDTLLRHVVEPEMGMPHGLNQI